MKKNALVKDTLREIKKSFGRFLSIFMIVGIGVAFFAGVKDSVVVMKNTADAYYDDYNFMDMKIVSPFGMTKDDAQAIQKEEGVEGVYPSYSIDALSTQEKSQKVFKLMSYPMNASSTDKNYINQMRVVAGRLPKNANECVVEYSSIQEGSTSRVGQQITFRSGKEEPLTNILKTTTYTIVGEVTSPNYLSLEKGSSAIGSGKIDDYAYIPDANFTMSAYTEIYVTIKGTKEKNSYSNRYFDAMKDEKAAIISLGKKRSEAHFDSIKKEMVQKIEVARKEYIRNKEDFDTTIAKAQEELTNSYNTLLNGQEAIDSRRREGEKALQRTVAEVEKGNQAQLQLQAQYDTESSIFNAQKQTFDEQVTNIKKQVEEASKQIINIDAQLAEIDRQLSNTSLTNEEKEKLIARKKELESSKEANEKTIATLEKQLANIQVIETEALAKLAVLKAKMDKVQLQINVMQQQVAQARSALQQQLAIQQEQLDSGKKKQSEGQYKVDKQRKDGANTLQLAKEKIDRNEENSKDLKALQWHVLDRKSHYSYMDYGSAADRMNAISKVFPLFFFLVAALVCLTTMTRMVDEQRQEIGTLKALGYKKVSIAMKYIIYAAIASILGGIFGAIIGMVVFPMVIFDAWGIMYSLPNVKLNIDPVLGLFSVSIASLITMSAAFSACYKELMETPALLMRPKAPKNGKRILLERIPCIWKRFNFIHKVTARNIFRYKKRFFMTVIGISGCSALLIAGFGIKDSIGEIANKQYGDIYKYDVSLTYKKGNTLTEKEDALRELKKDDNVKDAMEMAVYYGKYQAEGEDKGVNLYVPSNVSEMKKFVSLRTRKKKHPVYLTDEGVIITEKLAEVNHLSIGDTFAVDNGEGVKKDLKISGIAENYVGHAIYMTSDYYKNVYRETPQNSNMYAILKNKGMDAEEAMGNRYTAKKEIESISFYSGVAQNFQDTISSLSLIIIVLIISAGLLAFVVLYNLTNVNISERLREIATIKVLGFYDMEVSAYVYRENIFLTLIGACVGLVLGLGLHGLIMNIAEMDSVMFGRNINLLSFLFAILITIVFAIIVNAVMYRKLKQIPMVESLKSVE